MGKIDCSTLYDEISTFRSLPGCIDTLSVESFKSVYNSDKAATEKNILYIYLTEKPIPRLVGESNIAYIGQTKRSFKGRRSGDAILHATSKANSLKYGAMIEKYGPIRVVVSDYSKYGASREEAEGQLLWWYFQNHCEYPPINYTQTKVRNDVR